MRVVEGALVVVDREYVSGIWLMRPKGEGRGNEVGWMSAAGVMIVVEAVGERVRVIGTDGVVGWTKKSRLEVVQERE
jgi:hypothetical protein